MKTSSSILAGMILVVLVVDVVHVVADIHGCTRFSAQNYNENATIDDDSCQCNCTSGTGSCPVDGICPGTCPVEAECPNGETVQGCPGQNLCPACGSEPVGKVFAVDKSAGTPCFSLDCSECFVPITCESFDCSSEATNTANKGSGTACSGTCDANTCCVPPKFRGIKYFSDRKPVTPACEIKYFAQMLRSKGSTCTSAAKKYVRNTMTETDRCDCCAKFLVSEVNTLNCELNWTGNDHTKGFNLKTECAVCELHPCDRGQNGGCSDICDRNGEEAECSCPDGWELERDSTTTCKKTHPCDGPTRGGCDQVCNKDGEGSFCSCNSDYKFDVDGETCIVVCSSGSCTDGQKLCIDGADADGCAVEICVDRDVDMNDLLCPIENTTCPSEKSCGDGHSWVSAGYDARGCPLPGMCEVDEIHGCTRPSAPNYNENATLDDGSCQCNCTGGTGSCPIDGLCPGNCPVEAACPNGETVQGCPGQQLCPGRRGRLLGLDNEEGQN